jgi:Ca2+-dependent lipid-binding protein
VQVIKGEILINTELVGGKMDPFVKIKHGQRTYSTRVLNECGANPVWNQTFEFRVESPQDMLHITCMENDLLIDDFIGECSVKIYQVLNKYGRDRVLVLYDSRGQKTMNLMIEVTYNEIHKNI